MKSLQLIYPIQHYINLQNINCVQIGIECPYIPPISEIDTFQVILNIKDSETSQWTKYTISEKNILEFESVEYTNLEIEILKTNNPYLIIDIAYKTAD